MGGNSTKATSGINGAGTQSQQELGIPDNAKIFFDDTKRSVSTQFLVVYFSAKGFCERKAGVVGCDDVWKMGETLWGDAVLPLLEQGLLSISSPILLLSPAQSRSSPKRHGTSRRHMRRRRGYFRAFSWQNPLHHPDSLPPYSRRLMRPGISS